MITIKVLSGATIFRSII